MSTKVPEDKYFAYPLCGNCCFQATRLIPKGTTELDYFNGAVLCPRCGCQTLPGHLGLEEEAK